MFFVGSLDIFVLIVTSCKLQAAKRANKPKVPVPQAQDPIALIGELVKALNLYSNLGVGNHSNVDTNSNARGAFKKFWMRKTQTNWVFLTWSLCFIAFLLWPLFFVLWFLCFFCLYDLHCITFMHFILGVFLFNIYIKKKKRGKKGRKKEVHCCSCTILFVFENKVGQFIFTWYVYVPCLAFMSLFIALH